jgi:hypothetical protein
MRGYPISDFFPGLPPSIQLILPLTRPLDQTLGGGCISCWLTRLLSSWFWAGTALGVTWRNDLRDKLEFPNGDRSYSACVLAPFLP